METSMLMSPGVRSCSAMQALPLRVEERRRYDERIKCAAQVINAQPLPGPLMAALEHRERHGFPERRAEAARCDVPVGIRRRRVRGDVPAHRQRRARIGALEAYE